MPQLFTNNARALLASGITDTATSITVEASKADLFPTANTGTGSIPSVNNWFKATLQDALGNVEIVYVRTRNAGSGVFSNVLRGQEGTTARAYSAGDVVGLRITAADVEGSIAAANNSVQLTGNQTIDGVKTFSSTISGSITGNAATVTNGVYTTGDQTIGGIKTFSSTVTSGGFKTPDSFGGGNGVFTGNADAANSTQANLQIKSWFGIGFSPSISGQPVPQNENATWIDVRTGNFSTRGNVTAYASDERLKENFEPIRNAVSAVRKLGGYSFSWKMEKCLSLGFEPKQKDEHGLKAQEVQLVLPDAVSLAPFDDDGGVSRSGENFLTVNYERLVPLLVEAIKEQSAVIESLAARVEKLEGR